MIIDNTLSGREDGPAGLATVRGGFDRHYRQERCNRIPFVPQGRRNDKSRLKAVESRKARLCATKNEATARFFAAESAAQNDKG
jgi:hypothetical protein